MSNVLFAALQSRQTRDRTMSTLAFVLVLAFCIGTVLAFVATVVHIWRQRSRELKTLNELIENRRFFLALINNNLDTLAVSDPDGHLRFVNKSLIDLLGFTPEQISTMDFRDYIHPDDRSQFDREWATLLGGKDPVNFTPFRYYDVWGNYHWKRLHTRNMLDDPDIRGVIISSSDITDLIETMDALRLTEQRIHVALAGADIAIFNQDLEGHYTWVINPLFGHTVESLLGKTEADLFDPGTAERLAALRQTVANEGGHAADEVEFFANNNRHILSLHLEQLLDPNGQVVGVVGAVSDITQLRKVAEQSQLSQRLEAIGQLTGGIAHDFNNLLAVIVGNLELLQDHLAKDPQLGHFVELALTAADRGAALTRSLLAFARKQSLEIQTVDPNKILSEIAELLRRSLPPSIQLTVRLAEQVWSCRADAGQLQNAIINLVVNARDAMPGGGAIIITTANTRLDHNSDTALPIDVTAGDYILICVQDTGTGIPPEVLNRVFEPFFSTKPHGKGSGLGLSIVYGFAKQLGGHVTINSAVGQGTTICLYLPRVEVQEAETDTHRPATPATTGATILVVDDDVDVRQLTVSLLQRAGHTTLEASNGEAALAALQENSHVDLLLSDMLLGTGPSGLELIHKAEAQYPGMAVILMSGYVDPTAVGGIDGDLHVPLLRKPFRRQELETIVSEALAARKTAAVPEIRRPDPDLQKGNHSRDNRKPPGPQGG